MKILIAAALAVSALALAVPASAEGFYGNIGYSYKDGQQINLGGPTARIGWQSSTPLGIEGEASIGVDKDITSQSTVSAKRVQLQHQWAVYGTATGKITDKLSLMGRLGYGSENLKFSPTATAAPFKAYQQAFKSWNYGASATLDLDGVNGLRADYTRMNFKQKGLSDDNVWTIGYTRKFGPMK